MNCEIRITAIAVSLILIPAIAFAGVNFQFKTLGPTILPNGGEYAHRYPATFDKKGHLVFNPGLLFGGDFLVLENRIGIRLIQGVMIDCAGVFASVSHIGMRARFFRIGSHSLWAGCGPLLFIRESWTKFPEYEPDTSFEQRGDWENFFLWYGGDIEYNYSVRDNLDFSLSIIPYLPKMLSFAFGLKLWF